MTHLVSTKVAALSRRSALTMASHSGASHIGSSLSVIDILAVLYCSVANIRPSNATEITRDLVIVSKGHAASGVYAILAHVGFFPVSDLATFCHQDSPLAGHVTAGEVPGVEFSSGSLGHGVGFGLGVALAATRDGNPRHVYVVISDGECNEGSTWEAALIAAHQKLGNLTVIVDRNGLQSFGSTEETVALEPLDRKWESFGWHVVQVDGHDHSQLADACHRRHAFDSPRVVIATTTKGHGVSFMENKVEWHYKSPSLDELEHALEELELGDAGRIH